MDAKLNSVDLFRFNFLKKKRNLDNPLEGIHNNDNDI